MNRTYGRDLEEQVAVHLQVGSAHRLLESEPGGPVQAEALPRRSQGCERGWSRRGKGAKCT